MRGQDALVEMLMAEIRSEIQPDDEDLHVQNLGEALQKIGKLLEDSNLRARKLARLANMYYDEHGSSRGSYRATLILDFLPPEIAETTPYLDSGGQGLALIEVETRTVYARSSQWWPRKSVEVYLVGRNESGTFFSHRVPRNTIRVAQAISWIWGGKSSKIVRRQGDVAVIRMPGPQWPGDGDDCGLPSGHRFEVGLITHPTHPAIDAPRRSEGERCIVARRAAGNRNGVGQTRD